jgi:hypothetical protein
MDYWNIGLKGIESIQLNGLSLFAFPIFHHSNPAFVAEATSAE